MKLVFISFDKSDSSLARNLGVPAKAVARIRAHLPKETDDERRPAAP